MVELNHNKNLNDHLSDESIALFAEAIASGKEGLLPENIRQHVENCHKCKKDILAVHDLIKNEDISNNAEISSYRNKVLHKKNTIKSVSINIIKVAAVLLIIFGIGVFVNYLVGSKNNVLTGIIDRGSVKKNNSVEIKRPIASEPKEKLSAEQAKQNDSLEKYRAPLHAARSEFFENLIASNYRGGNIEVMSPSLMQQFGVNQSVTFSFKGEVTAPIIIKIYNNTGKKVFEKNDISSNTCTLSMKLLPGLYYWKLIIEGDLVYVGKFLVK